MWPFVSFEPKMSVIFSDLLIVLQKKGNNVLNIKARKLEKKGQRKKERKSINLPEKVN